MARLTISIVGNGEAFRYQGRDAMLRAAPGDQEKAGGQRVRGGRAVRAARVAERGGVCDGAGRVT